MSAPEPRPATSIHIEPPPSDGEYGTLDFSTRWPVLSLVCFLGALGSRFLVEAVPRGMVGWPMRLLLPGLGVLVLCFLGLVFGLLGLRNPEHRGLARVGVWANAIGLVLAGLAVAAFFWILRGPR